MTNDYDFLCGNDFTFVKIALGNDDYHTIKVQAELATTIDFSGGLRNLEKIIIDGCNNLTQIKWPEHTQRIKHLTIGNSANLDNLDLLGLVNLEELSIVNCEKLTRIEGLRGQIKHLNIQGCKLDSLDLSLCNKLEDFILTTNESNLDLNFKHNVSLHSVVINVELADHQKTKSFYKDNARQVICTFNECTHLNTLAINSPHTPSTIDITGCSNLKTALFLLDEEAQITGVSTCNQLDETLENKTITVNQHTIEKKKNALMMPENTADIETIIQQNGVFKNKKSCLVNLQLLMSPRHNSYIPIHNKYVINNRKISSVDTNSFHSKFAYQNKSAVLEQENKWWCEAVSNPIEQNIQFPSSFISQQSLWINYLSHNQENKYKKSDKLKLYVPQKQNKNVKNNHLFLAKGNFIALGHHLKNYKTTQNPLITQEGLIYSPPYLPAIGPRTAKPMPTFFINEVLLKTDEQEKKTGKKETVNSSDLFIVGPVQAEQVPSTATPALAPAGNENNNVTSLKLQNKQSPKSELSSLSAAPMSTGYKRRKTNALAYEINKNLVYESDLVGTKKETVAASPLTAEPVLTDYETETTHLSLLDIKIKANSQNALTSAEKIKAESRYLTSDAVLTNYEIDSAYLKALDIKEKTVIEKELIEASKVKAMREYLTINATEDTGEPSDEYSDLTFTVTRALVDLKPRNSDLFNDDFQSSYLTEVNEQINKHIKEIQDNLSARNNLLPVGKVQARNQYISADPILAAYESEETS